MDRIKALETQKWDIIAECDPNFYNRVNAIKKTFNTKTLESICVSDNNLGIKYCAYKRLREIDKKMAKRVMKYFKKIGILKEVMFGKYTQYMKTLMKYRGTMADKCYTIYEFNDTKPHKTFICFRLFKNVPSHIVFIKDDKNDNIGYFDIPLTMKLVLRIIKLSNGEIKLKYLNVE